MPVTVTVSRDALLPVLSRRDDRVLGAVLDLQSGEVRTLFDPVRSGVDNAALEALLDREPERYARVPAYDREYRLMCAYAAEVDDDALANELDVALTGAGAYKRFTDVLEAAHGLDSWSAYRELALLHFVEDWLATLGIDQVTWAPPTELVRAPGPRPGLVALFVRGERSTEAEGAVVLHRARLADAAEARAVFERAARDLCELQGQPWRRAFVRGRDRFDRDGVVLELTGSVLTARVRATPAWQALRWP